MSIIHTETSLTTKTLQHLCFPKSEHHLGGSHDLETVYSKKVDKTTGVFIENYFYYEYEHPDLDS